MGGNFNRDVQVGKETVKWLCADEGHWLNRALWAGYKATDVSTLSEERISQVQKCQLVWDEGLHGKQEEWYEKQIGLQRTEGEDICAFAPGREDGKYFPNIEVKTDCQYKFLRRDNDGMSPSGTISFELFGWLYDFFNEKEANERRKERKDGTHCFKPDAFINVLSRSNCGDDVYAVIAFEYFEQLAKRLDELAVEYFGKHLRPWELPEQTEINFWNRYSRKSGTINGNGAVYKGMWYVPFDRLADLARVVLVGEEPNYDSANKYADGGRKFKRPKQLCDSVNRVMAMRYGTLQEAARRTPQHP